MIWRAPISRRPRRTGANPASSVSKTIDFGREIRGTESWISAHWMRDTAEKTIALKSNSAAEKARTQKPTVTPIDATG
jgi:hypothetical protein